MLEIVFLGAATKQQNDFKRADLMHCKPVCGILVLPHLAVACDGLLATVSRGTRHQHHTTARTNPLLQSINLLFFLQVLFVFFFSFPRFLFLIILKFWLSFYKRSLSAILWSFLPQCERAVLLARARTAIAAPPPSRPLVRDCPSHSDACPHKGARTTSLPPRRTKVRIWKKEETEQGEGESNKGSQGTSCSVFRSWHNFTLP